jgi:hypothetical protein
MKMCALLSVLSPVLAFGCTGSTPAAQLAQAPTYHPAGGKCSVAKSQAEPLIVEWSSVDRTKLEALARQGIVAVHYVGCEMQVLAACTVPGSKYKYIGTTIKHDEEHIRDENELYAKLPLGAAGLEGALKSAGQLSVGMSIVGRMQADREVKYADLQGTCKEATHAVRALTVGAFEFSTGASAKLGGEVSAFGANAGAGSQASRDVISRDGLENACSNAQQDDAHPPAGCGALIRIELAPLPDIQEQLQQKATADTEHHAGAVSMRNAGVGLVVPGVLLLGAGVAFTLLASNTQSSITGGTLATGSDIRAAASNVDTFQGLAATGFAVGGTAFLTGVGLLTFGPSTSTPSAQSTASAGARSTGLRFEGGVLRW